MVNLRSLIASFLVLEAGKLASASPTPALDLAPRGSSWDQGWKNPIDCTGVAPSPGGQPCGNYDIMTCDTETYWSCPNGDQGPVPPGTLCICNAFRHPGWLPSDAISQPGVEYCNSGIVCVDYGVKFRVCGVSGLEPPQDVAPGTKCVNGAITYA